VTELPARERGVGVIFQSYALSKDDVRKHWLRLRIRRRRPKKFGTVNDLLALVQLEESKKYLPQLPGPATASGHRAPLVTNLKVLLFDEPFAPSTADAVHLARNPRPAKES